MYDPWPPDDESAASELGRGWQRGSRAMSDAGAEATGAAGAAFEAWQDTAGETMHGRLSQLSGVLHQVGGGMSGMSSLADGYARELVSVKTAIDANIAANDPIYNSLDVPVFGAALQQGFAALVAAHLRSLVEDRAAAISGTDGERGWGDDLAEWLKDVTGEAVREGGDIAGEIGEYGLHAVGEEIAGLSEVVNAPADILDAVAAGGRGLEQLGGLLPGSFGDALEHSGADMAKDTQQAADALRTVPGAIQDQFDDWGDGIEDGLEDSADRAGDGIAGEDDDKHVDIYVDAARYPEAAQHIREAQNGTTYRGATVYPGSPPKPAELTLDRADAADNRRQALRGIPAQPGVDRDEYPMALSEQGGSDSSVKYIPPGDNRGAGASVGNQIRGWRDPVTGEPLEDGDKIRIVVR